ncbi:4'-phosphopantetheinyl transferase [Pseudoalteromonas fenneropenaei]|uniref:Enterobactin synthase component D n=1 Tax=Pseudoalteromonas fenneropenaei TaxID=1737459 RepID=A0ABV7CMD8_9GAMM
MNIQPITTLTPQLKHAFHALQFEPESFQQTDFAQFDVAFPDKLKNAVAKRRGEYLAGRICAQAVLAQLQQPPTQIASGEDRAPIWPQGVVASITHSKNIAIAAGFISQVSNAGLGIDVEHLMKDKQELELQRHILAPGEEALHKELGKHFSHPLTLIFSAKESIFKALYPSVRKFFGFEAARLIAFSHNQLQFEMQTTLCPQVPAGLVLSVHYQTRELWLLTECEFIPS